jgi:DNA ligase-4
VIRLFEDAALERKEEGIIIKDPESKYLPNNRGTNAWIKLKTDYID